MNTFLIDIDTSIEFRLETILEAFSHRHNQCGEIAEAGDVCYQENSDETCASTQLLQTQKINWLICKNI